MYIYLLLGVFWILLLVLNKSSVKMVTGTKAFHLSECFLKIKPYQFESDVTWWCCLLRNYSISFRHLSIL